MHPAKIKKIVDGKVIRKLREMHDLRQIAVAKEAGLSPSRLSLIECGWMTAREDEVIRIEAAIKNLTERVKDVG